MGPYHRPPGLARPGWAKARSQSVLKPASVGVRFSVSYSYSCSRYRNGGCLPPQILKFQAYKMCKANPRKIVLLSCSWGVDAPIRNPGSPGKNPTRPLLLRMRAATPPPPPEAAMIRFGSFVSFYSETNWMRLYSMEIKGGNVDGCMRRGLEHPYTHSGGF